jgi:hypothetical protein
LETLAELLAGVSSRHLQGKPEGLRDDAVRFRDLLPAGG